jgi:hypothetical protein
MILISWDTTVPAYSLTDSLITYTFAAISIGTVNASDDEATPEEA